MSKSFEITTIRETKCISKTVIPEERIRDLLKNVIPKTATDVRICVRVPGGADWSNTTLVIGEDVDLWVEWKTESVENLVVDKGK